MTQGTTLAARIAAIGKDLGYIQKEGRNEAQHYKYVTEADVVAKIRPALADAGIMLLPSHRLLSVEPAGQTAKGNPIFLTTIESVFQFTDGREMVTVQTIGQGTDSGDKGAYKAMTGAKKYALLQAFLIATGDDPEVERDDEKASSTNGRVSRSAKQAETRKDAGEVTGAAANGKPVSDDSAGSSPAPSAITPGQLDEIIAKATEAGLDTRQLGNIRKTITGKESSRDFTDADVKAMLEVLADPAKRLAAAAGGTLVPA